MAGRISLEKKREELVTLSSGNRKKEADARAYGIEAVMKVLKGVDPKLMQVLAGSGMAPSQMIAAAFQNLAENADKIGNLNIAPELLQELMTKSDLK